MEKNHNVKLWRFPFYVSLGLSTWGGLANGMTMTTLPLLIISLNGSNTQAGLMVTLLSFGALVVRPIAGLMLDRLGRKPVLFLGTGLVLAALIFYIFSDSLASVFFLRILQGVGFGLQITAIATIASDIIPKERLGEGLGYSGAVTTIMNSLGPAIGLWIVETVNFKALFILAIGLSILGIFTGLLLKSSELPLPQRRNSTFQWQELIAVNCLPVSLVFIFIIFTYSSIVTFLPLYAHERNLGNASLFFGIYALVTLASRPLVDYCSKKFSLDQIIVSGNTLLALGFIILALSRNFLFLLISASILALGFGTIMPALNAVMIKITPVEKRGAANATFLLTIDLGMGLGALAWGAIAGTFNYSIMYLLCVGSIALAVLFYWLILRKRIDKIELN
jgi:MFS family permease